MYGINLTPTEAMIELALLLLFPVVLWGLYRLEQNREKKRKLSSRAAINSLG